MLLTAMACQFKRLLRIILVMLLITVLMSTYRLERSATPTDDVGARDRSIEAVERHCLLFDVGGRMFDEGGRGAEVHGAVRSCLIHSFSPHVEREAARRFLDPARDNIYYANSPAITWFGDQLVLVSRIWLDRERYEAKNNWPSNHFADNWLYTQRFDRHMRPTTAGRILGIPSPKQWWVGDGPIEPRLVTVAGKVLVTFNSAMAFAQHFYMDFTVLWDIDSDLPIIPRIEGGTPMVNATEENDMPRDKHWMAFVEPDDSALRQLHFVQNLDPLRILRCSLDGSCEFIQRDEQSAAATQQEAGFIFRDSFSHLRGGTPFELYRWPYFISVAHTTMYKVTNSNRYYTAHLVVLCARPTYRIVYVSNSLRVHASVYRAAPMIRPRYIEDGFIFPVGLIVENDDWLALGAHVNDHSSVILRLKGLKNVMDRVINLDRHRAPKHGAPVGDIQRHIHDILVNETHVPLLHKH